MKLLPLLLLASLASCKSAQPASTPPPLAAMEEPLELMGEPADEAARLALPKGAFTGLVVGDSRTSLEELSGEPEGVVVTGVVENSPADAAGLEVGDLVLEVRAAQTTALHWPSDWRRIELETEPGVPLALIVDRAGSERVFRIETVARVHAAGRVAVERLREERRVGVVVRGATEVEARAAALGTGGGAVVVGLTRESPWRGAGIGYGDLVRAVDGREVGHPQVLLDAIRSAKEGSALELEVVRGAAVTSVRVPLSRRAQELKEFSIPLVVRFERARDTTSFSLLFGLFSRESTPAAWKMTLLWFLRFSGGDADRLETLEK
jgi:S1-C subfamily serine protease